MRYDLLSMMSLSSRSSLSTIVLDASKQQQNYEKIVPVTLIEKMIIILFLLICQQICALTTSGTRVKRKLRYVEAEKEGLEQQETSSFLGSPFSMTFKRYRIDFSSEKRKIEESQSNIFGAWKISLDRLALKRKYKTEDENNCYEWVDLSDPSSAITKAISTSIIFWRAIDSVSRASYDHSYRRVLTFPYSTKLCVSRLVDIANWVERELDPLVSVSLDVDASIPTVIIRKSNSFILSKPFFSIEDAIESASFITKDMVVKRMKSWCDRILVRRSICPFTKSSTKSGQGLADVGVPVANIAYHHSSASPRKGQYALLMAEIMESIREMVLAGPSGKYGVSSILFSAPEFDESFELWAGPIFAILESCIIATSSEQTLGVVCFHPKYATNDGKSFPGFGHMHSVPRLRKWVTENDKKLSEGLTDEDIAAGGAWQRRTPHATINVLRADQLAVAESKRSTPTLYTDNIRTLNGVGWDRLQEELDNERLLY